MSNERKQVIMIETTHGLLNPEAMGTLREPILDEIRRHGFDSVNLIVTRLNEHQIETLYCCDLKADMRIATFMHLANIEVGALRVTGENAIWRFRALCGGHYNPALCERGSIREKYFKGGTGDNAFQRSVIFIAPSGSRCGEDVYYFNGIRAARQEELRNYVEIFGHLFAKA
jgi:nucleoside diphosphate kinase